MTPQYVGIFRLLTGEDVVSEYQSDGQEVTMTHPLKVIFRRLATGEVGVLLLPFLPEEVVHPSVQMQCHIKQRDIMMQLPIRESMTQFYLTVRECMRNRVKKHDQRLDDHLYDMSAMYAEMELKGNEQRILEDYEEQFNTIDDSDENITFN